MTRYTITDRYSILDNETEKKYYSIGLLRCEKLCQLLNSKENEIKNLKKENETLINGVKDSAKMSADTIVGVWVSHNEENRSWRGYYE